MQITDIQVHRVNLPLVAGYRWAPGVYFGATKGIALDPQALERCKQRYEREGVISQVGEPGQPHYRRFNLQ